MRHPPLTTPRPVPPPRDDVRPARPDVRRRGSVLIWATGLLVVLFGIGTLAVDLGRAQLQASRLQEAADASVMAAAFSLQDPDWRESRRQAHKYRRHNLDEDMDDVTARYQYGFWNENSRKFKKRKKGDKRADTVKVVLTATTKSYFVRAFSGGPSATVSVSAIATMTPPAEDSLVIPATANPWLAGMPAGTEANLRPPWRTEVADPLTGYVWRRDVAGFDRESPVLANAVSNNDKHAFGKPVTDVELIPGEPLQFDSIAGEMAHGRFTSDAEIGRYTTADGKDGSDGGIENYSWLHFPSEDDGSEPTLRLTAEEAPLYGEHGKSNVIAPINALMGVFLTDAALPVGRAHDAPPMLDFSTPGSRDFEVLEPVVNQVFFIGDGKRADGSDQSFVVPEGATRLFLGSMDAFEWNNNGGHFSTTIRRPAHARLVG